MTPERYAALREQKAIQEARCEQAEQAGFDKAATVMSWAEIVAFALTDDQDVAFQRPDQPGDVLQNHIRAAYIRGVRRVYDMVTRGEAPAGNVVVLQPS
jgi:hypothetical protein